MVPLSPPSEKPMVNSALADLLAKEGLVVRHCLGLIDRGLGRCNAA